MLQLTEFRDHKLVLSKRGAVDGGEYLTIPLDRSPSPTLLHMALLWPWTVGRDSSQGPRLPSIMTIMTAAQK